MAKSQKSPPPREVKPSLGLKNPPSPREVKPSLSLKNPPALERSEALPNSHLEAIARPVRDGARSSRNCTSIVRDEHFGRGGVPSPPAIPEVMQQVVPHPNAHTSAPIAEGNSNLALINGKPNTTI